MNINDFPLPRGAVWLDTPHEKIKTLIKEHQWVLHEVQVLVLDSIDVHPILDSMISIVNFHDLIIENKIMVLIFEFEWKEYIYDLEEYLSQDGGVLITDKLKIFFNKEMKYFWNIVLNKYLWKTDFGEIVDDFFKKKVMNSFKLA